MIFVGVRCRPGPMNSSWPLARYAGLLALCSLLALVAAWSGAGQQIDNWAYDFLLRLTTKPHSPSSAVIVSFDEASLAAYGGSLRLREPLARALEILATRRPSVVAVDIVLSEPGIPESNERLAAALARLPNVVLATHLRFMGGEWEVPLPMFRERAAALGHVHVDPDDDSVARRVLLAKAAGRERRWAMALEAFRLSRGASQIVETESAVEVGEVTLPARRRDGRSLWIRYAAPETPVDRMSITDLIENPSLAEALDGRAVFIGVQAAGGLDRFLMTPLSFGRALAGVEINANVFETLARQEFLQPVGELPVAGISLSFALAIGLVFWRFGGRTAVFAALAILAAADTFPLAAFWSGYWFPAAPVLLVAWASFLSGAAFHYLVVRKRMDAAESQNHRYQRAIRYVTHEMRTPLTAIQGSSELIERYKLSDEKRKQVAGLIHTESQRLGRMIEMFLGVEKLSSGEIQLRNAEVAVEELVAACIERARPLAERKSIEILHQRGVAAAAWGDRELLECACYNLITNAVKYSPAKTSITVRSAQNGGHVQISVEDRGYGMDEMEVKNIFRKFYRTRRAEESGESGTGLGLALVEEIVTRHGGTIEVESRVNRGSRFTLSLPRAARHAAPAS